MDLGISERVTPILAQVGEFIDQEIIPLEQEYHDEINTGDRWQFTERQTEILESLKAKAKEVGLWNFFLTEGGHGFGLNTVEYAYLAEEMGKSYLAAEVFNCAAPDTGNMEVLEKYGSEATQTAVPSLPELVRTNPSVVVVLNRNPVAVIPETRLPLFIVSVPKLPACKASGTKTPE